MKTHARIVVIGGGIVGCSIAYHLTKFGEKDVTLLERSELTAGSTWHAAGLLPLFNMSYSVGQLHKYSIDLYKQLEAETGQAVSFHETGNLRLAGTKERLDEYHNYCGTANTIGVPFRMISPKEIKDLWPLCNTEGLLGALFHPDDGHVAPADVTMALAKGAKTRGAEICLQTEVTAIEQKPSGEWLVSTTQGEIVCEVVVAATGNYARQTAAMVGLDIPVIPVEHQYIVTDDVPELVERKKQGLPEMAVLRESESSYYLREERQGYILGPYEQGAKLCFENGVPANFGRELLPGDIDRLAPHIEAAVSRVPSFGSAGVKDVVNGPISYTPDGNPYLGRAWGLRNFYFAEGFSFGITAAGGAGKVLAETILHGEASVDTLPARSAPLRSLRGQGLRCEEECRSLRASFHHPLSDGRTPCGARQAAEPVLLSIGFSRCGLGAALRLGNARTGLRLRVWSVRIATASAARTGLRLSERSAKRCAIAWVLSI